MNNLTRNIFSQTMGQIFSLLINLFAIALAARYLGVSEFGIFNYLLAVVIIITKLIDLGIAPNIFREYSITKKLELINTGILIRILSFLLIAVIFNILFYFLNVTTYEIILSNIIFINLVLSSKGFLRELIEIPFKVDLKIHLPVIIMLFDNILFLFFVYIMPYVDGGLSYFVTVYTLSNLPGFFIMLILINKHYGYQFKLKLSSTSWLIKNSLPLFIYTILNTIFLNVDLLLLKKMDSSFSAGIYSAAARITLPMLIVPIAFIHSIFPQIIHNYHNSPLKNFPIIKFLFKILFLLPFMLAVIATFKSDELIQMIYGSSYLAASSSLIILLWSQIFLFNSFLVINLLVAYNKQRSLYFFSSATLFLNILLNILLIPQLSYMGATYAKILSILVGFIITSIVLYRLDKTIYLIEKRIIFFVILALGSCYLFSFLSLSFYLITSILFIILLVIFVKFFDQGEIKFLLKIIKKEDWYGKGLFFIYSK